MRAEAQAMTTSDPQPKPQPRPASSSVDDIFGTSEPVRTGEDLARDGVFETGELEEFLADLYVMRRSDVA
jgi:hypothetical protein